MNIKFGCRVKSLCDDCTHLKSKIEQSRNDGNDAMVAKYQADLDLHQARKKFKKKVAFIKKINAMRSWNIPELDQVVSDYLADLSNISDNQEDVGALNEMLFERPQNNLLN